MEWSSPANYVRLRDDCYLFTWIEEACNGIQGVVVFNNRTMQDVGFDYHAGTFDLKKYFGPKQGEL